MLLGIKWGWVVRMRWMVTGLRFMRWETMGIWRISLFLWIGVGVEGGALCWVVVSVDGEGSAEGCVTIVVKYMLLRVLAIFQVITTKLYQH